MSLLYDRRCVLLVGSEPAANDFSLKPTGVKITDLRMTFKVTRDIKPLPNPAEVLIYNLKGSTREAINKKGIRVVLHAGYADDGDKLPQVFSGDVRNVDSEHTGSDWTTKILAGDGHRAIKFARASQAFAPGTQVKDVVKGAIKALQTDPGSSLVKVEGLVGQFPGGYTQHGRASDELTGLLEPYGWSWSVQDGRIEVLGPGESVSDVGPLISQETGLVGSPTLNAPEKIGLPPTLKVRSLLQARLRPGQRFELRAKGRNGVYRCRKVVHTGDTSGGDWFTEIEAWA